MVGKKLAGAGGKIYLGLIFVFLYGPIVTLMVLSVNESKFRGKWGGFSFKWYESLFSSREIMDALWTTLLLALVSALAATVLGTAAAFAMNRMKRLPRVVLMTVTNIPMLNADIVTGISLMLLFLALNYRLGFSSVLIAHITFNLPYVVLSVLPKLKQMNRSVYEAALDLGASRQYAFMKVIFPDILPGILTGFLLSFTMSLDDFVITHFTKGVGIDTLSTKIYAEVRKGIKPEIYALSTIMFVTVFVILIIVNRRTAQKASREQQRKHPGRTGAVCLLLVLVCLWGAGCGTQNGGNGGQMAAGTGEEQEVTGPDRNQGQDAPENASSGQTPVPTERSFICESGTTLEERFELPAGYHFEKREHGTLTAFLREYPLKKAGKPVLLYDGREKGNQSAHAAVFKLPIEKEDLQQCADSVMRVYAEYFWETKQYEKISFSFGSGFQADYSKWRQGYTIQVNGDTARWVPSSSSDVSYDSFKKYLRLVFAYAGTATMEGESEKIARKDIQVGDVFLKGGSPGHVVMVVSLCERGDGAKAFLLAQGYMPAQEFHVLKNPRHENDPWYYEEEVTYPFETPEYTFGKGSLRRLKYNR